MLRQSSLHIAVFPGDGIGVEVMDACIRLLEVMIGRDSGLKLDFEIIQAGAGHYSRTGTALPDSALERASRADAILFGAMGLPDIRYEDGREIAPQIDLREELDLYAGVRPVRVIPGVKPVLSDERAARIDFVLVRESTEGLFAGRNRGTNDDDHIATNILEVTRPGVERVSDFAFRLAARRRTEGRGTVTCIDKANVLSSMAFFRKVFDEVAERHADAVDADHMYVDAAALNLVRRPWDFDVMVTENMFGDILSDLGAALLGGLGLAPSADIGDDHAVFQPCHGSAPDIMGTGKANPIGMFLSAAMMFDWLAERHGGDALQAAGNAIRDAVDRAFASGAAQPVELGGSAHDRRSHASDHRSARRLTAMRRALSQFFRGYGRGGLMRCQSVAF